MSSKPGPGSMLALPSPRLTFAALLATGLALVLLFSLRGAAPAAAETEACPNAEFRTGPSAKLPDCRAYEQVSPVNKYGQAVWFGEITTGKITSGVTANPAWLAPGSERVLVAGGYGDPKRGTLYPNIAARTASGWSSSPLIDGPPPTTQLDGPNSALPRQMIPSADRSSLLFSIGIPLSPDQPASTVYDGNGGVHKANSDGSTSWVSKPSSPEADLPPGSGGVSVGKFLPVGGSDDLSTVYFMTRETLTAADVASGRTWDQGWALYKVEDGVLSNAGTLPDGSLDVTGSMSAGADLRTGGNETVLGNFASTLGAARIVSRNGDRALFLDNGTRTIPGRVAQLYMHRDGEPSVLISKRAEDSGPIADSTGVLPVLAYKGNAADGGLVLATGDENLDTVLFSTRDALTDGAVDDGTQINTYRYELATKSLELLPELQRPAVNSGASQSRDNIGNVYAVSGDAERILFRTPTGEIKLWRDGLPTLTLASGIAATAIPDARFADDNRTLVFASYSPVGGEPNHPAGNSYKQTELYRFAEGESTTPTCISCPPPEAAVQGVAALELGTVQNSGFGASITSPTRIIRNNPISADGEKVYFTSNTPFDPRDRNSQADVYEWTTENTTPRLISSGDPRSRGEGLVDVDASGDNVLFASEIQLTSSDVDELYDFYVARVDGGLPDPPPFDDEQGCKTGTCQGDASPTPETSDPGSAGFSGGGNVASVTVKRLAHKSGAKAKVLVRVSGPGKVQIKGQRIRGASKRTSDAGTYGLRVKLNRKAKRALRRNGSVRANARVTYRSRSGERASKKLSVKFTKPNSRRSNRKGSR